MQLLTAQLAQAALAEVGRRLRPRSSPIELVLAGGVAGLLEGSLRETRTTVDCDVMSLSDRGAWAAWADVLTAAEEVATSMNLPSTWLNRDCAIYEWCLPLGWRVRCEGVGKFGPLTVVRLGRFDLIASKVMSSPDRPHDLEDLRDLQPSDMDWRRVEEHLERLQSEDLDGRTFDKQRAIVAELRRNR